jgi:hypothetical protein
MGQRPSVPRSVIFMNADFLDAEAEQFRKSHEQNMPCRRAIGLLLDEVKQLAVKGRFTSEEEALSDFRLRVRDLRQCKKAKPIRKAVSRRKKPGTKLRYKS